MPHGDFFISAMVRDNVKQCEWLDLGLHLHSSDHIRAAEFGEALSQINTKDRHTIIIGDFNAIRSLSEK